jgi:hypothetical protein
MLLFQSQFCHITAIQLSNCFKVTIGLSEWFPSSPATELEGRLYLCSEWVY